MSNFYFPKLKGVYFYGPDEDDSNNEDISDWSDEHQTMGVSID